MNTIKKHNLKSDFWHTEGGAYWAEQWGDANLVNATRQQYQKLLKCAGAIPQIVDGVNGIQSQAEAPFILIKAQPDEIQQEYSTWFCGGSKPSL
jgi:hypothetical protein